MTLPRITFWFLVIGGMFGLATSVVVYNSVFVAARSGRYTNKVFVVENVGEAGRGSKGATCFWADGRIEGKMESISLLGFDYQATSLDELKEEFSKGRRLKVWYDPTAPNVLTQGKKLRVLPGDEELSRSWLKAALTTGCCFGPLIFGGLGLLLCRYRKISVHP